MSERKSPVVSCTCEPLCCRRILTQEPFLPERLSADCRNLMTSLLAKNPEKRLGVGGVEDVKCHPWFKVV